MEFIKNRTQTIYLTASFIMFLNTFFSPFGEAVKDAFSMLLFITVLFVFILNKIAVKMPKGKDLK
ncbi:hypothetical protein [Bacillus sp. AK031]